MHGQETEVRDTLILGSYTEQGSAALIDGKEVVILPQASAYQLYGTPMAYFVNALKDGQLTFVATGDNGEIWQADFREDKLIFKSLTSNQEKTFNVTYDNDKLPGQTIMFSAADDKCYGMIKSVDFDQDSKTELPDCVYSINDQEMLFEIFMNVNGRVLKGCGTFLNMKSEKP